MLLWHPYRLKSGDCMPKYISRECALAELTYSAGHEGITDFKFVHYFSILLRLILWFAPLNTGEMLRSKPSNIIKSPILRPAVKSLRTLAMQG